MENIKKYYLYLKNLLDENEYILRIKSVYNFYESTFKNGYVTIGKQPESMFIPKIYEADIPMYYLMQIELYLNNFIEQDYAFITRLYPKINLIGSFIEQLFGSGEKSHIAPIGKSQFLTNEKNQNYPNQTSFLE